MLVGTCYFSVYPLTMPHICCTLGHHDKYFIAVLCCFEVYCWV
uniref:Uncharacterized protein n=1 Tax=Rhizophora mucronata TaxID=61149 RepID=A0A2P2NBM5_RHIMU